MRGSPEKQEKTNISRTSSNRGKAVRLTFPTAWDVCTKGIDNQKLKGIVVKLEYFESLVALLRALGRGRYIKEKCRNSL